jgi:hypothetical protein
VAVVPAEGLAVVAVDGDVVAVFGRSVAVPVWAGGAVAVGASPCAPPSPPAPQPAMRTAATRPVIVEERMGTERE